MKLKKITWENYKEIDKKLIEQNIDSPISFLSIMMWSYYGSQPIVDDSNGKIRILLELDKSKIIKDNNILFQSGVTDEEYNNLKYIIFTPPFIKDYELYIEECISLIKELNPNQTISFVDGSMDTCSVCLNKVFEWNTNYIYETESLKTFSGKKLQKKRNHLNSFKKNFGDKVKLIKYDSSLKNEFLNFCFNEIDNSDTSDQKEKNVYTDLLNNYDESKMFGSILYLDDKIIGCTFGYVFGEYYEIIIERATKEINGAYQYLLSENLKINNINTKYVNRQDDAGMENIMKSKMSYYPIKVIHSNVIKLNIK